MHFTNQSSTAQNSHVRTWQSERAKSSPIDCIYLSRKVKAQLIQQPPTPLHILHLASPLQRLELNPQERAVWSPKCSCWSPSRGKAPGPQLASLCRIVKSFIVRLRRRLTVTSSLAESYCQHIMYHDSFPHPATAIASHLRRRLDFPHKFYALNDGIPTLSYHTLHFHILTRV